MREWIARRRVALGFAAGALVAWLAEPACASLAAGGAIALAGEALRIWAAGHLDKSREVTSSGPYRFFAHPLYIGSAVMGAGLAVASRSLLVTLVAAVYFAVTITAAVRTEEAFLRKTFGNHYDDYRRSEAPASGRGFELARAIRNREYRAAAGLAAAIGFLWWKSACPLL